MSERIGAKRKPVWGGDPYGAVVVIPARWASERLPGKALVKIAGKPMIEHVYRRSFEAAGVEKVIIATDSDEIFDAVKGFGGEAVMTGVCRSGTDRVAEVARSQDWDIVINVQGDEPLIPPKMIEEVLAPFRDDTVKMASLKRRFLEGEDPSKPQAVKVVTDRNDDALYFSRSLIPFSKAGETRGLNPLSESEGPFLHIGIYAFKRDFLLEYAALPDTPLERAESLEQLRALEHGHSIRVPTTELFSIGVDTPEDLERVREIMGK